MSILKSLKLAAAAPALPSNTEYGFRAKLLGWLAEQKALAEAEITGKPFTATRRVTRTNDAGEKVRVEAPRHVRKGWFTDTAGKMFMQVRYGAKPIELVKGMNAVEVQNLAALPAVIGAISDAVNAGELDTQLQAAISDRKANFKPRAKKAAA
ncbi:MULTISPECIES: hypothetical protein [unclassified Sphingomonas]|jgi:hypothetical protein|uniref:hypothetical protein n=1 Tax=unclassified Sphingomonas TaxID=196159 RepID=UPI000E10CD83|nr:MULTISPECIES: hypothetical protein [unclassified Sphingomonas]AXJ94713.1 hypothetical protein DM480_03575 [Sphingomonas sp. FARSPH]